MATVEVTAENREEILKSGAAILYFTADWCPPCQMLRPIYDEVSGEFPEVVFGKVDVDQNKDLARAYGVQSIPTLIAHRQGDQLFRERGAKDIHQLRDFVRRTAGK